jgi:beta-glucosidase
MTPTPTHIKQRVSDLLAQMTLQEKIRQLGGYWFYELQTKGQLDLEKVRVKLKDGVGQITRIAGAGNLTPLEAAKAYNQIQKFLLEETRLGIPTINHEECCSGLMALESTVYPQMIGLASTFQPELARKMTQQIRKQMLAIGARQGLAPVLDVGRDPRWGRIEETFGEDPLLVSQFGKAYIQGLQGEDPVQAVMATGKHFIGHAFSQGGLNCGPVHLGERDLWDIYLAPFQAAIRDAGLMSMMNAYPELDGELVAASKRILTELLRDTLGFDGVVVSDYEAVVMIHTYHKSSPTRKDAAVRALAAGIDVELPTFDCYMPGLQEALEAGELSLETIDLSVTRHLTKKFELGLFENPYVDENAVLAEFETPANRELAKEIAGQSLVLLKNDGTLPLKETVRKIALIGPNADNRRCMLGDYSYSAVLELMHQDPPSGSGYEGLTQTDIEKMPVEIPTVFESLKQALPVRMEVAYAKGCEFSGMDKSGFAEAVELAQDADLAVLVLGHKSGLAYDCTTGEFRDSTDLGLPGVQAELLQAILEIGKPVVLVLINGRPLSIPGLIEASNAVLEAWVPGEEGAGAIVSALLGELNPGGKLPVSIARSVGQVPVFYNYKPSGMRSNIYGDYVNESVKPLFPFGHGLSYTQFEYSNLSLDKGSAGLDETLRVSLDVSNVGKVAGDEVVQLYTSDEYAEFPRPVKELRGFVRLHLLPGEKKHIRFDLPINMLAYYGEGLKLVLEPGTVKILVGSSSEDIRLQAAFEVRGETKQIVNDRVLDCPVTVTQ